MAETVLDQILFDLRNQAATHYPERGEFKNLRVVGHTPKNDHFIYDACIDFAEGSERVAIKVYRAGKIAGQRCCAAGEWQSPICERDAGRQEKAGRHSARAGRL